MRRGFMVTSIIFSKDRPLQLDLCLSSIKKNFQDTNEIIVIEKYSDEYRKSLNTLKSEHPEVKFYPQSKCIYKDIKDCSLLSKNNYICFFTDDDIFYDRFFIGPFYKEIFEEKYNTCCLSLRLGLNIFKRSHNGAEGEDRPYMYHECGDFMLVPKTCYGYGSYWSYSHSLDGHIFRKETIINIMDELSYLDDKFNFKQTPNELEAQMQRYWALSENNIVCPKHSCVFNSPNNRVSDTHKENSYGDTFKYEAKNLLDIFIAGKRINFDLLDFQNINCPHQEVDILKGLP
jgi:hypothetical protein